MKTLTIGNITLELNSFSKHWDRIGGVYAEIKIPTSEISFDDLRALLNGNQHDLIVTEEDGSTESYSGYAELNDLREAIPSGVYVAIQYCTSTAMHLLNEARKEIAALQNEKAEQKETIATLALQNAELNETVNALLGLEG